MTQVIVIPFAIAFALAVAFVPLCRRLAFRLNLVAHPRDDRWHRKTIPMLGGIAIGLATFGASAITGIAGEVPVFLGAAMVIFVVGLVDDVLNLKPSTKLVVQLAMASVLVAFDFRLNWVESRLLDSALTMVWVVGLTNAFNLLDNMDGLCAGTAVVVALMMVAGLWTGVTREIAGEEMAFLSMIAGAASGFLVYNFPPASIFMGDCGSLMLGFSLAAMALGSEGVRGSRTDVLTVIVAPVFVLLIPIFDTTLVTVARILSGRSPAVGGRDHSSHRLVAIGLSERSAVFLLWGLAAMGGAIGLIVRNTTQGWSIVVGGLFLTLLGLFAVYLARVRVYDDRAVPPARESRFTPLVNEFMHKRRVIEVMADFVLIGAAYYLANRWRFDVEAYAANADTFYGSLPIVVSVQLVSFFIAGVYRGEWHYFVWRQAVTVLKGAALGVSGVTLFVIALYDFTADSKMIFVYYALLVPVFVIASRASLRLAGGLLRR
ncbi:MAG: undecaprenyl/decaprenyl-phosphate alpha-N-acetylglucosaminyl 1-phosphate transferase [Cyanobacteria bacterium]|nr:undecaprenyl/decaprenyl-phosphate alpha-N-acetylglucosaminyl 1-phosphate transferase [Cyanobacteriota bacterium]